MPASRPHAATYHLLAERKAWVGVKSVSVISFSEDAVSLASGRSGHVRGFCRDSPTHRFCNASHGLGRGFCSSDDLGDFLPAVLTVGWRGGPLGAAR